MPHDCRNWPRPCNSNAGGYIWTFLDEARDPSLIVPGAVVIAGDEDAPAVAVVVDLVDHPSGTVVHLDILPGTVEDYLALARRTSAGT